MVFRAYVLAAITVSMLTANAPCDAADPGQTNQQVVTASRPAGRASDASGPPVPRMTPDLYYGFAGPAFEKEFEKPPMPVDGRRFRSDYRRCGDGLEIANGPNLFNRPLYIPGCQAFLTAGDRPAFILWTNNELPEPKDSGWGRPHGLGYCFVGLISADKSKWFHQFESCRTVFHPGWVEYHLADAGFPGIEVRIEVVPSTIGAFLLDIRVSSNNGRPSQDTRIVWTHGCLNFEGESCWRDSYDIQSRAIPWDEPEMARNDQVTFTNGLAILKDPKDPRVWATVGSVPTPQHTFIADAADRMRITPDQLIKKSANGRPVAAAIVVPPTDGDVLRCALALQWGWKAPPEQATRFSQQDVEQQAISGKRHFQERTRRIAIRTGDPDLDTAFRFAAVATDAMWHPPGINHAAYSWGGLTTIFRIFYGLTCCGDHDRIGSALRFHCGVNQKGQLLNLAASSNNKAGACGYESYGSTVDMLWHHYLWTGDREMLRSWAPVIDRLLEYEEKTRKDARGLFIDHLGFWCSDSFDYQEGCAVGTTFVWRMYQLRGKIAQALGQDPSPFEQRAKEIRSLMMSLLWYEKGGFFYDSIPADGEPQPAAIAPAIYHPIEYGLVEGAQADRMFDWMLERLTSEAGVVRVNDWFPINWSHNVYSPMETANAAVAAFRIRRGQAGLQMLNSVVKGTMRGAFVPGSISCLTGSQGYTINGTDFGDGVSLFVRTVVEGLFGVHMNRPADSVTIAPNLSREWPTAELTLPDVKVSFRREVSTERTRVEFGIRLPRPLRVDFSIPAEEAVAAVRVNGQSVEHRLIRNLSRSYVCFQVNTAQECVAEVDFSPPPATAAERPEHNPRTAPTPASAQSSKAFALNGLNLKPLKLAGLKTIAFSEVYRLFPGELTWNLAGDKEPRSCAPVERLAHGPVEQLIEGVPFALDIAQVPAIRKGSQQAVWRGIDNLEVPEELILLVDRPASDIFLLASGLCSPMTCHLPQVSIELRYQDGNVVEHRLTSPGDFDYIAQHTSKHLPVAVGWFGLQTDLARMESRIRNPLESFGGGLQLLHADVIHLKGRPGLLETASIRALKRHSGLVLYGVTTGRPK